MAINRPEMLDLDDWLRNTVSPGPQDFQHSPPFACTRGAQSDSSPGLKSLSDVLEQSSLSPCFLFPGSSSGDANLPPLLSLSSTSEQGIDDVFSNSLPGSDALSSVSSVFSDESVTLSPGESTDTAATGQNGQRAKRKRRLSKPAKTSKNVYERQRLHVITEALDDVQSSVWKERVARKEDRRKRANILQRTTAYIRLLRAAVDDSLSPELMTCLRYYAAKRPEDKEDGGDRTLMLQLLLQGHQKELAKKALPPAADASDATASPPMFGL